MAFDSLERIALVLWRKPELILHLTQVHLGDLDPVPHVLAREQLFHFIPRLEPRRPIIQLRRQILQQSHGHIPMRETQVFQQKPPRRADAARVAAPVCQTEFDKVRDVLQSLGRARVRKAHVLRVRVGELGKEPGFDQGAAGEHEAVAGGGG